MLVSLMARLNAISQMHNAHWAMMQNNMAMMNMCRSLPSFGGNLAMLNHMDAQFAMSAAARISQELKDNKISYIA